MQPTVSLFGAHGDMGRYILAPLLKKHADLRCLDRSSPPEDVGAALQADLIVLSVPQEAVKDILNNVRLRPDQIVIEICSIKRDTSQLISHAGGTPFSLHPMNGPHTPWTQQKWVIVGEKPGHPLADWFLELLKEKQVMMHDVASAELHDFLMSVVLGVPEMTTVFLSALLTKLSAERTDDLSIEDMLKCASPAFASLFTTHVHTIASTPQWLRKELLTTVHPSFLPACLDVFAALGKKEFYADIDAVMERQMKDIKTLPVKDDHFPVTVRQLVTQSFNTLNAVSLGEGLKKNDALYIQKTCGRDDVLAGAKRIRVGIHGIRGAFTDEAWHRFTTEVVPLPEDSFEVVELIHSLNVLRAVNEEEIDVGIFAFANSGSGGYLASIEAMGEYSYDLIALFTMPIHMCILGHPSVESIHQLDAFYGHPVAISQCRHTLAQRWPDIPIEAATDEMDTALSAKLLAEGSIPPTKGIFAAKRAADIYGLKVLAEGVHHDPHNATAFAVVRKR